MSSYPMDEQVGRLIGNLLAGGGAVFLPGVGSLYTERQGARRLSKRLIQLPCRRVAFTPGERGRSLVACIAEAARCDEPTAQGVYDRWIGRALVQDELTVAGVGTLKFKHFTPTEEFETRLNPQGREPVRVKPVRRFDWVLWLGIAAIVGVLGFVAFWWMCERTVSMNPELGPARTHTAATAESAAPADVADIAPAADSAAGDAESGPVGPAEQADSTARPADPGTAPVAGAAPSVGTAPAAAEPQRSASLVSGRKYVVLGVFSTSANAERAVEGVAAKNAALSCGIYRFGGKFLVSPFESDDAEACTLFIRAHADEFPDMWTYTAR